LIFRLYNILIINILISEKKERLIFHTHTHTQNKEVDGKVETHSRNFMSNPRYSKKETRGNSQKL